jgi:pimeloyl-ACP methyl ester carboxylesterase
MAYANLQGLNLFYEHCDQNGSGKLPLVFVHGFGCTHDDWQSQVEFFKSRHPVITLDLPGHGLSDPPEDSGSVESFGAAVASLLKELDLPPAVLIGHSMGCRIIVQATLDAPERVAKLILLEGSRVAENDPQVAEQQMREHIEKVGYAAMVELLFADMFVDGSDPTLKQRIIQRALKLPETVGAQLFVRLVGWDAGKADAALAQITIPAYVLQSTYLNTQRVRVPLEPNEITPWMELVQQHVPTTELDVISGVGLFPMLEAPDIVNEKMRAFIAK